MDIRRPPPRTLAKVTLIVASLVLSVWGIVWGAPAGWHPDEITGRVLGMVRERDPNPHYFAYGGLHHYVVGGLAVIPVLALGKLETAAGLAGDRESSEERTLVWTIVAARTISALMTAAMVAMTIEIGTRILSPAAGLAAGLLLLLAPGSVMIAHFATVDAAANFWYWLACLGTLSVWKTGARRAYLLAGVAAGLAIGTKLDRGLVLLPLVVAHLLRGRAGRHRDLVAALAMVPLAFVVSNPALVIAPFEFLDGFTRDLMFNALRPASGRPAREFAMWLQWGLGTPLLMLMAAGVGVATVMLMRARRSRELVWVAATAVPIVVLYSLVASMDRYATLLFPALVLLAGYAVARVLTEGPRWQRLLAAAPIAAALSWSLVACVAVDLVLLRDPRYAAAEWLDRNAPAGSRVAMDERGPSLPHPRYRVSHMPADRVVYEHYAPTIERLRLCGPCERVRTAIFEARRRVARALGRTPDPKPYTAWFDGVAEHAASRRAHPPDPPDADYVLLLPTRAPLTAQHLAAPGSGYRLAASFPPPRPLGMTPPFPFIGPPIEIYARARRD